MYRMYEAFELLCKLATSGRLRDNLILLALVLAAACCMQGLSDILAHKPAALWGVLELLLCVGAVALAWL